MQTEKELLQEKKEELFQFEKVLDKIDQDLSTLKSSSPDDYEKYKEFASKKKKHIRASIRSLKEEIYAMEDQQKARKEVDGTT